VLRRPVSEPDCPHALARPKRRHAACLRPGPIAVTEGHPGLPDSGERLVPEASAGRIVLAEHLARYLLAARLVSDRRVLDAACGEGYGSAILQAAGARSVIGVDIDEETVEHARRRHGVDARVADIAALPIADRDVEVVVSFETIEHVAEPERALDEFRRVLAPDGVLVISTPNPGEYLDDNPFHLRELSPQEFQAALEARFGVVRLLYQQNFLSSTILDAETLAHYDGAAPLALDARKVAGVPPSRSLYLLAVCAHREAPALEADVAVLSDVYEAHELAQALRNMAERASTAERIQSDWEARASEAERQRTAWEERSATAEHNQRAWQARAEEAERQADELRGQMLELTRSLSWRVTRPLRDAKSRLR
jgi:SAM-dependent methyltransferase